MRLTMFITLVAVCATLAMPAFAELQTVQVGGEITIRGNWMMNVPVDPTSLSPVSFANYLRWSALGLAKRPLGSWSGGNAGIFSDFAWDQDNSNDAKYVSQRTRLNVKADFTNDVSAFIELDAYNNWGDNFRSDYVTGADNRLGDNVVLYQAYIEAKNMWGIPLSAKIGRQEISLGSGWLVGTNEGGINPTGLSFDGVRLSYGVDVFSVDAFMAKLAENGVVEQDGDIDLYGLYASFKGIENVSLDGYALWLRDAQRLNDTNLIWFGEWIENVLGLDDYDVTNLYTVGLRGAGTLGQFDFEAEFAYQWGDADQVGFMFNPLVYGDADADFGQWAGNLEVGYTFDIAVQPRIFLGGAYFGGEDNRDLTFFQWLNPFYKPSASVSFNRLFSNWQYSPFFDADGALSNVWLAKGGVSIKPMETVEVALMATYFQAIEAFDAPLHVKLGRYRVPILPFLSFATSENDKDLGWEVDLSAKYKYSEDLSFKVGYSHLFSGKGLTDGAYVTNNGLAFSGGTGDDDADYVYVETKLAF